MSRLVTKEPSITDVTDVLLRMCSVKFGVSRGRVGSDRWWLAEY